MTISAVVEIEGLLDDLIEEALTLGVEIELELHHEDEENLLWIASFQRTHGRSGAGTKVLEKIFDFASDHDLVVEGQIDEPGGRLALYYIENGFDIEIRDGRTIITRRP